MSPTHPDNDVAMPHASLLAYFRPSPNSPASHSGAGSPSNYSKCDESYGLLSPRLSEVSAEDEEADLGFWDAPSTPSPKVPNTQALHSFKCIGRALTTFCCFWCTLSVFIMGALALCFIVDFGFSLVGMGTGMAQWIIYRHQLPPTTTYEIPFCLDLPNREAPGPQIWRLTSSTDINGCSTDTISFKVNSHEAWKMHSDDLLAMGDGVLLGIPGADHHAVVSVDGKVRVEEQGDDLAEEGQLL